MIFETATAHREIADPREEAMASGKLVVALAVALAAATNPATAQKRYDPGASDTEVKIGNIMPYSGRLPPTA
jgi:hypothetical protein